MKSLETNKVEQLNIQRISVDYIKENYKSDEDFEIDTKTISDKFKLIEIDSETLEASKKNRNTNKSKKEQKESDKELKELKSKTDKLKEDANKLNNINKEKTVTKKIEKETVNLDLVITNNDGSKTFNNLAYTNSMKPISELKNKDLKYSREYPYKEAKLLTEAEHKLFKFLQENIVYTNKYRTSTNKVSILAKVRLADLFEVDKRLTSDKNYFYKISSKHIDFIVYDEVNNKVICGIELFDFTHRESRDTIDSDKFKRELFHSVGIQLVPLDRPINDVRIEDIDCINDYIAEYFKDNMRCPLCNGKMHPKRSRAFKNYGHMFYSCNNYPSCRGNIDIN